MSNPGVTGAYHLSAGAATFTWSDAMYALFGFTPGDVVPTVDLVLSHQHPDDLAGFKAAMDEVQESGAPFGAWHRLRAADGTVRRVLTVGSGELGPRGEVLGISGYCTDVTEFVRRTASRDVDDAMEQIGQSRPMIEQAKGALMHRYRLDEDAAFALLRRYSQLSNVKLRDVARDIVGGAPEGRLPGEREGLWDRLADDVRDQRDQQMG